MDRMPSEYGGEASLVIQLSPLALVSSPKAPTGLGSRAPAPMGLASSPKAPTSSACTLLVGALPSHLPPHQLRSLPRAGLTLASPSSITAPTPQLVLVCGAKRAKQLEKPLNSNLSVFMDGWLLFFSLEGIPLLKPLASWPS